MSDASRRMDATTAGSLLELAEELSPSLMSPSADDALERLEPRADELEAAIGWLADAGRMDEALRLANALYRFWIIKRRFVEGDRAGRTTRRCWPTSRQPWAPRSSHARAPPGSR